MGKNIFFEKTGAFEIVVPGAHDQQLLTYLKELKRQLATPGDSKALRALETCENVRALKDKGITANPRLSGLLDSIENLRVSLQMAVFAPPGLEHYALRALRCHYVDVNSKFSNFKF